MYFILKPLITWEGGFLEETEEKAKEMLSHEYYFEL